MHTLSTSTRVATLQRSVVVPEITNRSLKTHLTVAMCVLMYISLGRVNKGLLYIIHSHLDHEIALVLSCIYE